MSQNKYNKQARKRKQKSAWPLVVLVAGGLLLVFGAIFVFSQPSKPKAAIEVNGSPSLKVDKEEVDLGEVKLGQTVQVSFQITNVGDQPLRFAKNPYVEVKEGC
jgi:cell division septal protein FtsQ